MLAKFLKKYRAQLGDSIWSLSGLVVMNIVAQILLYPILCSRLGDEGYGDLQYLMAYINIITVAVGCAANLARMTSPEDERLENNGDYHIFLLLVALLGIPFAVCICRFGGVKVDRPTEITYYLLFVAMAFRYYADVMFKITLNFRRYFLYYAAISVGYGFGVLLFLKTGIWPLAILPGEAFGVLFAYLSNKKLRTRFFRVSPRFLMVFKSILILTLSEGISNLIFNADRLLLKWMIGGAAVTVYYLATLVGKTMSLVATPLNSVLIGYLAKYNGSLTKRTMKLVFFSCLGSFMLFSGLCVFGGWIVLLWLYPENLTSVMPYLFVGSLAQVVFFTTNVVTVILIRFAKKSYQVIINATFGLCFLGFCIPATYLAPLAYKLWAFAIAIAAANVARFVVSILLGFRCARESEKESLACAHLD